MVEEHFVLTSRWKRTETSVLEILVKIEAREREKGRERRKKNDLAKVDSFYLII